MIPVQEAEKIILQNSADFPAVKVPLERAIGRVLREEIIADQDFPPFNRIMMDGIAIKYDDYENGITEFSIQATQGAGQKPLKLSEKGNCIEIMTGAVAPIGSDTVIPYEDISINHEKNKAIVVNAYVTRGKNIHLQGTDKKAGNVLAEPGIRMMGPEIGLAASVGMTQLNVTRNPRVAIISSGDELVDVDTVPAPHQIRRSNNYAVKAELLRWGIKSNMLHLQDDKQEIMEELAEALRAHDIIILSGGVSRGKYDYIPDALNELGVNALFHRVQQKPGKPFWFGRKENTIVFAFPGNPVSTFMCLHRYFMPWLRKSMGLGPSEKTYATLSEDFEYTGSLTYFLQVKISVSPTGCLFAIPYKGGGSGDHTNLNQAHGFLELPAQRSSFNKGDSFPIYLFRDIK